MGSGVGVVRKQVLSERFGEEEDGPWSCSVGAGKGRGCRRGYLLERNAGILVQTDTFESPCVVGARTYFFARYPFSGI